jgi:hypothetical protein
MERDVIVASTLGGPGQIPGALLFCRHAATLSWSPSQLVQELLGHATVAMTLDRYSHVLPGMEDQSRRNGDRIILAKASQAALVY